MDTAAFLASRQPQKTRVGDVPVAINHLQLASVDGKSIVPCQRGQLRGDEPSRILAESSLRSAKIPLKELHFGSLFIHCLVRNRRFNWSHLEPRFMYCNEIH